MNFIKFIIKKVYLKYKFGTNLDFTTNIRRDIKLEEKVNIGKYCSINCKKIGKYTFINEYTRIDSHTNLIGRFCSVSHNVKIGLGSHPLDFVSTNSFCYDPKYEFVNQLEYDSFKYKGYTVIGNDVLISANAIILAGVTIGDGAVIGAGSVVTKDVEPYSIVAGIPAIHIKYRFTKQQIDKLLKIKWWNLDENILKHQISKFKSIEEFIND
jgi:acetyltransferase-like isoleucine patch superfamily enzyme